ncbi:hypothetical protein XENTR_v10012420 [Xenopus tropicalis]|uniref:Uncharacterized protein LOC101734676 n=1 Tax=Xenopus tropicalis TaxID=8364 RepID=A0A8J0R3Z5_XENTR|nr:uncharacterized protein LOC101734676 [Xenopus tropicalis]KAE8611361.1 hypothetical protein XENTR_v10012420 [Xenopus tropicalis]
MFPRNNKITPLPAHTATDLLSAQNASLEGKQVSGNLFQGVLKEQRYCQGTAIRCQQRNGTIKARESSLAGQNTGSNNSCVILTSAEVHKPSIQLSGLQNHLPNGSVNAFRSEFRLLEANPFSTVGISSVQNGLPRYPHHLFPLHLKGEHWSRTDPPKETEGFHAKPEKKNVAIPLCPSCNQRTVQVFPAAHNNTAVPERGIEPNPPMASTWDQSQLLSANKHTKSFLPTCEDCLRCFACTCPPTKVFGHYYAMSVICWLAIILTIVIVIATTLHNH